MSPRPALRARAARLIALADISVPLEGAASPGDPRAIFALAETYNPTCSQRGASAGSGATATERTRSTERQAPKHGRDRFALTSADQGAFESTGKANVCQ
jgi:hypothetical protein